MRPHTHTHTQSYTAHMYMCKHSQAPKHARLNIREQAGACLPGPATHTAGVCTAGVCHHLASFFNRGSLGATPHRSPGTAPSVPTTPGRQAVWPCVNANFAAVWQAPLTLSCATKAECRAWPHTKKRPPVLYTMYGLRAQRGGEQGERGGPKKPKESWDGGLFVFTYAAHPVFCSSGAVLQ